MSDPAQPSLSEDVRLLHFLVVENNPTLLKAMIGTLREAGASKVTSYANGAEALREWENHKDYGVVICSWNLPEVNGIDILKRIRADQDAMVQPAVIMLSSDSSEAAQQGAMAEGADAFLGKPFSAEDLIPRVQEGAEKRKASSGGALTQQALESALLGDTFQVELVFDRYTTTVECDELRRNRCVIRVSNNYGLGTRLTMRFARRVAADGAETHYKPIKGTVLKTERVPKEYGVFRLHVEFSPPVRESMGIRELLRGGLS